MKKSSKKTKKRKINYKNVFILIVVLAIIIATIVFLTKDKVEIVEVKPSDNFSTYNYIEENDKTEYYNELFEMLKIELNNTEVNNNLYVSIVSQLFLTDFFSLDDKTSKNDIGGTQFVYAEFQTDFEYYAKESIYKNLENIIFNERTQDLPVVNNVEVVSIQTSSYTFNEIEYSNSYSVDLKISYEEDLDYQTLASLVLINNNGKYEIVKMF